MSRILLVIEDSVAQNTEVLAAVRRNLGMSLAETRKSITEEKPLFDKPLFDRADPGFPEKLLALFEELDGLQVNYCAHQVLDGQEFSPLGRYYEVDTTKLRNLIKSHTESLEEQRSWNEVEGRD